LTIVKVCPVTLVYEYIDEYIVDDY
jgi:hypothetical protein